jgi:hypothetical protein
MRDVLALIEYLDTSIRERNTTSQITFEFQNHALVASSRREFLRDFVVVSEGWEPELSCCPAQRRQGRLRPETSRRR